MGIKIKKKKTWKTIQQPTNPAGKIEKAKKRRLYLRIGLSVCLILTFVGIYVFIRPDPELPMQFAEGATQQEILLEELLRSGTTQELVKRASELKVTSGLALPLRMERIRKRMRIAESLLKKRDDALAQKNGMMLKIEGLHQIAKLSDSQLLGIKDAAEELNALVTECLNSPDPEIAKIARVSVMVNTVQDFLDDDTDAHRVNALNHCRQLAEELPEDREIATAIFQIAKVMKSSQGYTTHSVDFFDVVYKVYIGSKILLTKQIALRSYDEIVFGDDKLAELKESVIMHRDNAAQDLSKRMEYGLNKFELGADEVAQLFSMLIVLIQSSEMELALTNVQQFSNFLKQNPENANRDEIQKLLSDAKKQIASFGKPLSRDALISLDGQLLIEPPTGTRARLLVFWSPNNMNSRKTLVDLDRLPPKLRELTQIIAVYEIDQQNMEQEMTLVNEMADQLPQVKFATIDADSDAGKAFKDRFPITQFPFLILLDRENVVCAVNPSMLTIRSQLRNILE